MCGLARLRRNWRTWASLALIVALAGGIALGFVVGGRRTDTAYASFASAHREADILVFGDGSRRSLVYFSRVAKLPGVLASAVAYGYNTPSTVALLSLDGRYGSVVNSPKVLVGRLPRRGDPTEAAVNFTYANTDHLRVGQSISEVFVGYRATGRRLRVTLRVVGITAMPGAFPPLVPGQGFEIILSPSFFTTYGQKLGDPGTLLAVRLKGGSSSAAAFRTEMGRTSRGSPPSATSVGPQTANVERSIHLQAVALDSMGICLALIAGLLLAQLISRQSSLESVDNKTLASVGLSRNQLTAVDLGRNAGIGLIGAVAASVVAVAVSPVFPLGIARTAEPTRASQLTGPSSGPVLSRCSAWSLSWASSQAGVTRRLGHADTLEALSGSRPIGARVTSRLGLQPPAGVGVSMALDPGRGRSVVPVRATLSALVVALATLAAAATFSASATHLLATPRLYGWNWDVRVTDYYDGPGSMVLVPRLRADPWLADIAVVSTGVPLSVNGHDVDGLAIQDVKGHIGVVMLNGRTPTGQDDDVADNLNPIGRVFYSASTLICTPASLSQEVGAGLGAQAGESRLSDVAKTAGFSSFRRATETPFNLVFEGRP